MSLEAPLQISEGQDAIIQQPDGMVNGFSTYNSLATKSQHPVEEIQKLHFKRDQRLKHDMAYHIYGKHFMEGLEYEQVQIAKLHAQGHNSSHHSLEISMGTHTTVTPEDYMSLPQHQGQLLRQSPHAIMQKNHDLIGQ
jgi:hypothetical protein